MEGASAACSTGMSSNFKRFEWAPGSEIEESRRGAEPIEKKCVTRVSRDVFLFPEDNEQSEAIRFQMQIRGSALNPIGCSRVLLTFR